MTPFFFGDSNAPLYGIYAPPIGTDRGRCALLCYPLGHEYSRAHWSLGQLALHLSRHGFHVLRFDYTGTGDSAGRMGDWDLPRLRENIHTAAEELLDMSGVQGLTLVGLRTGASLAAECVATGLAVRNLVMWDPVSGAALLRQLRDLHEQWERQVSPGGRLPVSRDGTEELVGHPFDQVAVESLGHGADLPHERPAHAQRIVVVTSKEDVAASTTVDSWTQSGGEAEHVVVPDDCNWTRIADARGPMHAVVIPRWIAEKLAGATS